MGALFVAALGGPLYLALPLVVGFEAKVDNQVISPHELVEQVTDTTKYLQTLATSVLGLIGLLMSERVSTYWLKLSSGRRQFVVIGGLLCAFSIYVGFVTQWTVLSMSDDNVVRSGVPKLLPLNLIQAAELAAGVLLIGITAFSALGEPPPPPEAKKAVSQATDEGVVV
jgi:hypothetical protein